MPANLQKQKNKITRNCTIIYTILFEILTRRRRVNFGFRYLVKRTKLTRKTSVYPNLGVKVGVALKKKKNAICVALAHNKRVKNLITENYVYINGPKFFETPLLNPISQDRIVQCYLLKETHRTVCIMCALYICT